VSRGDGKTMPATRCTVTLGEQDALAKGDYGVLVGVPARFGLVFKGGPIELEQMDSAGPPRAVNGLYGGRHDQHRCRGTQEVHLLAVLPLALLFFTGLYLFDRRGPDRHRPLVVPPEGSAEHQRIGQNTGFSFLTEDVRSLFEEWTRRGVCFRLPPMEPSWGSGQARYAVFEDVEGNSFSLIEFDEATRTLEAERRAQAARLESERQAAHDLAIAKQVQTRLFPQRQPLIRTLVYAGICHPARTVGGDYYDFLDLGSRRLGLVVADIAGKGIGAALLMANLQAALRSQCATAWEQPERFMRSVNQLLYENTAEGDYATLFFAEYDDDTRKLRYSNCGHPPALLLRGDDGLERLGATLHGGGLVREMGLRDGRTGTGSRRRRPPLHRWCYGSSEW
jgi:hypothetical protein